MLLLNGYAGTYTIDVDWISDNDFNMGEEQDVNEWRNHGYQYVKLQYRKAGAALVLDDQDRQGR